MRKITIILSILALIASGCGGNNKATNNNIRENKPFQYDESKTLFSGAFAVSPEYFAELTLNTETGKLTVIINGQEMPFELSISGSLKEVFETLVCIATEDLNKDGYVDFILTPNCNARFPASYVYLFDKDKKYFVVYRDDESEDVDFFLIGNTTGFITRIQPEQGTLNPLDFSNRIEFVNDDGSNWFSLPVDLGNYSLYVERDLFQRNSEFKPWAFEPGIEVFAIRCIDQTDSTYIIVVNEDENLVKQLKKHEYLKFQTIEEHVINRLVGTDLEKNPIRKNPSDNATIIDITNLDIDVTHSIERNGDWIKIVNTFTEEVLGWIRWKKDDRFMISLYYSI
jgi:hypothetical protein